MAYFIFLQKQTFATDCSKCLKDLVAIDIKEKNLASDSNKHFFEVVINISVNHATDQVNNKARNVHFEI